MSLVFLLRSDFGNAFFTTGRMATRGFQTSSLLPSRLRLPQQQGAWTATRFASFPNHPTNQVHCGMFTTTTTTTTTKPTTKETTTPNRLFPEDLNILYDSKCNVCQLEMDFLQRRDARLHGDARRRLRFTDLESRTYNPNDPANGGVEYATGMAAMHAVTSDGRILQGVSVFQAAYQAVGWGWWFFRFVTTWPWAADALYHVFAKYRTRVTRGASLETLVQAHEEQQALRAAQQQQQQQQASSSSASNAQCHDGMCASKTSTASHSPKKEQQVKLWSF